MSDEDCKYFVKSFIRFLQRQMNERNFSSDVVESLEVATQCLEAAYETSSLDSRNDNEAAGGSSSTTNSASSNVARAALENIDLFELFQEAYCEKIPNKKEKAEEMKNEGNRLMKEGKYGEALLWYNKAISLDATNPVFYCNRAAARLRLSEFEKAISDCKMSLLYNPNYSKAYGRLGIAYSNLKQFESAIEAYEKAIELEPENQDYKNNLRLAQQSLLESLTGSGMDAGRRPDAMLNMFLRNFPNLMARQGAGSSGGNVDLEQLLRQAFVEINNSSPGDITGALSHFLSLAQQMSTNPNAAPNTAASAPTSQAPSGSEQTQSESTDNSQQNPNPNQAPGGSNNLTSALEKIFQDMLNPENFPPKE